MSPGRVHSYNDSMNRIGLIGFGHVGRPTVVSVSDLSQQANKTDTGTREIENTECGLSLKVVLSWFLQSIAVDSRNTLTPRTRMRSDLIYRYL